MNKVATYMGRPLAELTKEELIKALEQVGNDLCSEREAHIKSVRLMQTLSRAQRV